VILDGGSTRVFSPNDAALLEEDLETLKVISFTESYCLLCCNLFIFLRDIRIVVPFYARWVFIGPFIFVTPFKLYFKNNPTHFFLFITLLSAPICVA
jgi:hypothetical protein